MTTTFALERARAGTARPGTTAGPLYCRHNHGTPYHIPTSPMSIITTAILFYQPDGRLVIAPDDVAALRAAIESRGGHLEFEEALRRGFIYGAFNGLPVYDLTITLPDDVDARTVMAEIDPLIKALVRRNTVSRTQADPA